MTGIRKLNSGAQHSILNFLNFGQLVYKSQSGIAAVLACAAWQPPCFGLGRSWRLNFFDLCRFKRPPFQKYTILCCTFPTWAAPKDLPFQNCMFLCYFSLPKFYCFINEGPLRKPSFLVRGCCLSFKFLTLGGTYIPFLYMSTLRDSNTPKTTLKCVKHYIISISVGI